MYVKPLAQCMWPDTVAASVSAGLRWPPCVCMRDIFPRLMLGDMGSPLQVVRMLQDSAALLQMCQVSKQAGTLNSPTHSWWRRLYAAPRFGQLTIQHTAMKACILSRRQARSPESRRILGPAILCMNMFCEV